MDQWGRPTFDTGMNIMRTMMSFDKMKHDQKVMDWREQDRGRAEIAEQIYNRAYTKLEQGDEMGLLGLKEEFGDRFSISAFNKAQADLTMQRLNDVNLRQATMREDMLKAQESQKNNIQQLQVLARKNPGEVTTHDVSTAAHILASYPGNGFHVKEGSAILDPKTGNLTFSLMDSDGKEIEQYSRPWDVAMRDLSQMLAQDPGEDLIRSVNMRHAVRLANAEAMANPTFLTNSKGEVAALVDALDRYGRPVQFAYNDRTGELLSFSGSYEDMSEGFKEQFGESLKGLPKNLGKGWRSPEASAAKGQAISAHRNMMEIQEGKETVGLDELKKRLDIALSYWEPQTKEGDDLSVDPVKSSRMQRAVEAFHTYSGMIDSGQELTGEQWAEYGQAQHAVSILNQIQGEAPIQPLNVPEKITEKWVKDTFLKMNESEMRRVAMTLTDEQDKALQKILAKIEGVVEPEEKPDKGKEEGKEEEKKKKPTEWDAVKAAGDPREKVGSGARQIMRIMRRETPFQKKIDDLRNRK